MLLAWLPLGFALAASMDRRKAALFIIIGGALFLPELVAFKVPVLPPLDKHAIMLFTALVTCRPKDRRVGPARASRWLFLLVALSTTVTALLNSDPVSYGEFHLPGIRPVDAVPLVVTACIKIVIPFYLGQILFGTPRDLELLLRALVIAAILYVPLALFETRMSPILHTWIYGFFQHTWNQMERGGGYRPIAFMSHALSVAFLFSQGAILDAGLLRAGVKLPFLSTKIAFAPLALGLMLGKSLASILYAATIAPLVLLTSTKMQLRVARYLALFVLAYPILRLQGAITGEWLVENATKWFGEDRAWSLNFRFRNENMLLERAAERIWFGWSGFARNRIFNEAGKDLSVVDGEWIGRLGMGGVVNFFIFFLALLWPVFRATKAAKVADSPRDRALLSTTALVLTITGIDLLPNASSHRIPMILAGALTSCATTLLVQRRQLATARG